MDFSEIQDLIKILESSGLTEIEVEEEGRRIRLSKQPPAAGAGAPMHFFAPPPGYGASGVSAGAAERAGTEPRENGLITIDSPMVGTFYTASSPGKPPFVLPGDTVEPNQTVCIVEAMKIMNEVAAKVPAIIEKVLVENGEPVEFGQPLFTARPLI